jgi:hypothetical protein
MLKVNGRGTPSDGKSSRCLWQGELKSGGVKLVSLTLAFHLSIHSSSHKEILNLIKKT